MSRPQTLPQLLARLSTGAGAHAMPTLASLHLSYPTTGAGSAGARRFAKQILPRLKFANPRVAVECDVWRPVATKGLAEEEVERVTKEAAEQGLDKRRAVMYVQFDGMTRREIVLDKPDTTILRELLAMGGFAQPAPPTMPATLLAASEPATPPQPPAAAAEDPAIESVPTPQAAAPSS